MKHFISNILIIGICSFCYSKTTASFYPNLYSFDTVTDARSVAMGESFVAYSQNVSSFKENPAVAIKMEKFNTYFNYRSFNMEYDMKDYYYYSIGATIKFNWGSIAVDYTYFNQGGWLNSITEFDTNKVKFYDETITLSYARPLFQNLSVGLSYKSFATQYELTGTENRKSSTQPADLFDLGLIYDKKEIIKSERIDDNISLGLSLQNFGTSMKESDGDAFTVPTYLRTGFAYEFATCDQLLAGLITGEYRRWLNHPDWGAKSIANIYGWGFETTFLRLLALRVGGVTRYWDNYYYGPAGETPLRYGAGIHLPLSRIGLPLTLSMNCSFINLPEYCNGPLAVFSISAKYLSK